MAKALLGLFGESLLSKGEKTPKPKEVAPAPDLETARSAEETKLSRKRRGRGRAGTILTEKTTLG